MKFDFRASEHEAIIKKYPNAITIAEHITKHGELKAGTMVVNHSKVSAMEVTDEMLARDFPSFQFAYWFYVI